MTLGQALRRCKLKENWYIFGAASKMLTAIVVGWSLQEVTPEK
jgi:hypothetical protein